MAVDLIARALALSGGGGGGGGTTDYNDLSNRPQINNVLLRGNKSGADLGLAGIEVVSAVPTTFYNDKIYVIPGDSTVDPPIPDKFYVAADDGVYQIQTGRVTDVDYNTEIINRPKIDNVLLKANNNTHEELELISEKDFVTTATGKGDGMEFVLPEGTPDNPIEISEINDTSAMKYADNYTSSNNYINTQLDEINRILSAKMQVIFVDIMPADPSPNTIYYVSTPDEGVYDQYIIDSLGQMHLVGSTELNLTDYVQKTRKVGTNSLANDITPAQLASDVSDQTATLTNKTIDATGNNTLRNWDLDIFSSSVVKTAMPVTPTDTQILTAKAVKAAVLGCVPTTRKVGSNTLANDITPQNIVDDIRMVACTLSNKTINAASNSIENLKTTNFATGVVQTSMASSPTDTTLLTAKAVKTYVTSLIKTTINSSSTDTTVPSAKAVYTAITPSVKGGTDAIDFSSKSSVFTSLRFYSSSVNAMIVKSCGIVAFTAHIRYTKTNTTSAWYILGTIPSAYRPASPAAFTGSWWAAGVGCNAVGGHINTDGKINIWFDNDISTYNEGQIRISVAFASA